MRMLKRKKKPEPNKAFLINIDFDLICVMAKTNGLDIQVGDHVQFKSIAGIRKTGVAIEPGECEDNAPVIEALLASSEELFSASLGDILGPDAEIPD